MKKIICCVLSAMMFCVLSTFCYASDVKIMVNGSYVQFDQPPVIIEGRTLVPVRVISEMFDVKVQWDEANRTVTLSKESKVVTEISTIAIGASSIDIATYYKSGQSPSESSIYLDVPAQIINGRTLIPLRAVSEILHKGCIWNGSNRTVFVGNNPLDHIVGIDELSIAEIKKQAMEITKNGYKQQNIQFSDWGIERFVTGSGYFVYCKVQTSVGLRYMSCNFKEIDGEYICTGAFALKDSFDMQTSRTDFIYSNGRYL